MKTKDNIKICNREFRSKTELKKYVSSIAKNYNIDEQLNDEDFKFIYEILLWHHRPSEKIGCGVKSFQVYINSYGKRAFRIIQDDGNTNDFSWDKCIKGKKKLDDFKAACRSAVRPEIKAFKTKFFEKNNGKAECPLMHIPIDWSNSDVDHAAPYTFKNIFDTWLLESKIDVDNIEIGGYGDNEESKYFKDEKVKESFVALHHNLANLRVISHKANLFSK